MNVLDFRSQTTLITGASSGIGAALARELAARGSGLVLVARRLDRLDALAAELRATHGVEVATAAADLSRSRPGPALRGELRRRGITVTSLVNNAGFGSDGAFQDEDPERLADEIAVNVASVVDLTSTFLGDLRAAGHGALVNVTSEAAYQPIPGMAVYAASKAFVLSFTEALWAELRGSGVRVLAFAPGLTATEFFDQIGTAQYPGRFQTPEQVAAAAVRALERRTPGPSARARRSGAAAGWLAGLMPRRTRLRLVARLAGSDRLMRARDDVPARAA
ncbi:SDR family NAD(P)-dependent oxidoreductase [Myceligenerans salitolerans]|uniref:SDR family NAD(P)-dependent oxidoreductase n=1 Tax=Myceligenerans salitolerans TaxID=1230528 RepID=A0ABS3I7W2_9MICO|nr:SDR family NAD(P)-dependent oxidoreductase [Myceligenerans salitolerans]MBO0609100.1 SDR family NAD(P)-dependent oxidoreductase [Myceligenerans salitolerans]